MSKLKIGDTVLWRGAFGNEPAKEAKVESMQRCKKATKYGKNINSADWDEVKNKGTIVVDLDNGHWAYGEQLSENK